MTTRQREQIKQHGEELNAIFNTGLDPIVLCKKLRRLENKATILTTDSCNTGNLHDRALCTILGKVKAILFPGEHDRELYLSIFINTDPCGYALKIKDKYVREHHLEIYRDWGGYGILAPEFTGK